MSSAAGGGALADVAPGSHVCWLVPDEVTYIEGAKEVLGEARSLREKPFAFGPQGSPALEALAGVAQTSDPRIDFLGGGPLDPDTMFAMFHEQSGLAREEGYHRIRLVADMDWLLPAQPTASDILSFELLLDRHTKELGATIVCAYRRTSFGRDVHDSALCVHPLGVGASERPLFQVMAGEGGSWRLTGEVDLAVIGRFEAAMAAAATVGRCVIDATELGFIDMAGLRTIAGLSRSSDLPILVTGARPIVERAWAIAGFDAVAPLVTFAA